MDIQAKMSEGKSAGYEKDSKNRSHGLYSNQSTGRGFSYYEI